MHRSDHDILIIGDFNASITRTSPNTNDKLLRSFVAENALVADNIEAPSFRHHDGKKSSKIDYLMTTEHSTHLVRSVLLLEDDYRNTSSRVPFSAKCTLAEQFCTVSAPKQSQTTAVRVPQWNIAYATTFQHHVTKHMKSALPPDVSPTAHPTQSSYVIMYASVLQQAIRYATHKSVPVRTLNSAKFKHTLPRGAVEKLKQGRILRRNLKRKFQIAAKEESRISPEFLLVKQNRKEVRDELRRAERTRRNKLYTRICRAPMDKAFHKLVQTQRKNASRKCNLITDRIGLKHDEKEGQLMALTQHYSELALPSNSPCFDQDFSTYAQSMSASGVKDTLPRAIVTSH